MGDTVQVNLAGVEGGGKPVPMQIVGRSTFPFFGHGSFTPTGLGVGAQVADTPHYVLNPGDTQAGFNFVLVHVAPGRDHDANVARLERDLVSTDLCGVDNQCTVTTAARPVDIVNYDRVLTTPIALAAVLAFLAVLIVAYLLITSVRRRRHDFAILKVLGFTRGQVSAAVAWQATTLAVIALVVGIPLGLVLGRFAWATFAANLPVPSDPVIPAVALALAVPAALFIANMLAIGPGISAARRRPAAALRTQ